MGMAYRVQYGNDDTYSETTRIRLGRTILMTIGVMAVLFSLTAKFWPEGKQVLDKLTAFHGLRQIQQHLEIMVLDLRSGASLSQTVTAFCRDVIQMGMDHAA